MDLDIFRILAGNKEKPFVKRIMEKDKYPVLKNPDGSVSTHSMAWGSANGKHMVFPTVVEDGKKLKRLSGDEAFKRAMDEGDYIEFNSPEAADWFSKEYKQYWSK